MKLLQSEVDRDSNNRPLAQNNKTFFGSAPLGKEKNFFSVLQLDRKATEYLSSSEIKIFFVPPAENISPWTPNISHESTVENVTNSYMLNTMFG